MFIFVAILSAPCPYSLECIAFSITVRRDKQSDNRTRQGEMAIALFGKYKKLLKLVGVNRSVFTQSLITKQTVSETTACGFGILQRQACTLHKRTNERLSCGIREGQRGFCTSFSPAQSSKSKAKAVENLFDTNVKSDVLLFSCYKSDRFYVVFCWASVVWFVIICLVAEVARFTLKQLKPESDEDKEKPWYKRFNLKNPIVRNAFVVMIFLVGKFIISCTNSCNLFGHPANM